MATRAHRLVNGIPHMEFIVASGQTVTAGYRVKFASADDECQNCGAGENGFGIAINSGASGDKVTIALLGCGVVPVKVGTGGATRGAYAVMVADGHTDRAIGGGTTVRHCDGVFMQSGSAGDLVGMLVAPFGGVSS